MYFRRKFLIAGLALGVLGGYGSALCSWRHCHHDRQQRMEQHIARVCVDAARQAQRGEPAP